MKCGCRVCEHEVEDLQDGRQVITFWWPEGCTCGKTVATLVTELPEMKFDENVREPMIDEIRRKQKELDWL